MNSETSLGLEMPFRTLGIVGGLGALAGADLLSKLVTSRAVLDKPAQYHFLFEQHPFKGASLPLSKDANLSARRFYVYQVCKSFEARGADAILLPCFASQTFRAEIEDELAIPLLDMMQPLNDYLHGVAKPGTHIGVLTSDFVRHAGLFAQGTGHYFKILYPCAHTQSALMEAVYGARGIKKGHFTKDNLGAISAACRSLQEQGAELVVPGMTELSLVSTLLKGHSVSILDVNEIYACAAVLDTRLPVRAPFKLGIVGGVGPAATVDFMAKVVEHTPAAKDQEHIKLIVEQNPQIPDRTAYLLHNETNPTIAMYAACTRLERAGAHAIAIPCNTAHAFVGQIQAHIQTPIINMLTETLSWIAQRHGAGATVGLLATSGTIQSQVYHQAAKGMDITILTPDETHQAGVMEAIYGDRGIKAGYTKGSCESQLQSAMEYLHKRGATVIVLGCTELPLVLAHCDNFSINGHSVALVDPTTLLAMKCVELATRSNSHPVTIAGHTLQA